tara:strand:- start:6503 stop:6766 length:264 start_codon:yes stop_codon:yes gene_type:complete
MVIDNHIILYLLMFVFGVVVGIYIMTQVEAEQNDKLMTNILEMDDNIQTYKEEVDKLIVAKRNVEIELKLYKIKDEQLKEVGKFLES